VPETQQPELRGKHAELDIGKDSEVDLMAAMTPVQMKVGNYQPQESHLENHKQLETRIIVVWALC